MSASTGHDDGQLHDHRWLIGHDAERWLRQLADEDVRSPAAAARLRKDLSAGRTHLLLEQIELRRRAKVKFARADEMFFTRRGLEQATDEAIAAYKAGRFGGGSPAADLCCGIGGDLAALASRGPALGVDRDRIVALLASENMARLGRTAARVVVADVAQLSLGETTLWHLDPDRRPGGRRSTHPAVHEPDAATIDALLDRSPDGAIKLAPVSELPPSWRGAAELEWISRHRECRQLVAWFGRLGSAPGTRRATRIVSPDLIVHTIQGRPDREMREAESVGRFVFEPDPAVLAADLAGEVAERHALAALTRGGGFLTGDRPVDEPLLAAFEVDDVLPADLGKLKRHVAARRLGPMEIKIRGLPLNPADVHRRLHPTGDTPGVLILLRRRAGSLALLARRLETGK